MKKMKPVTAVKRKGNGEKIEPETELDKTIREVVEAAKEEGMTWEELKAEVTRRWEEAGKDVEEKE